MQGIIRITHASTKEREEEGERDLVRGEMLGTKCEYFEVMCECPHKHLCGLDR